MIDTQDGHVYDYPHYYDIIFAADWKDEYRFLLECFGRFGNGRVRRVFEPACGTGRLLVKLAQLGFEAAGNDLNPKAVAYCNRRLARHGLPASAVVADMADFSLRQPVDAAFNLISSFRHLSSEAAAQSHLKCVADALVPGGLYLLGLHLTPPGNRVCDEETWTGRRGRLKVVSRMWSKGVDHRRRIERVGMRYDVITPTRRFRLVDEMPMRTYTAHQMRQLLDRIPAFQILQTCDFRYDLDSPIRVGPETEDVVYVLRKHS